MEVNRKFRYSGEWWLPNDPGRKFHGILEYDGENQISLSLDNSFFQSGDTQIIGGMGRHMPIVLGEVEAVEKILFTLYNSLVLPGISDYGENAGDKFLPSFVFKNSHFRGEGDIKFERITGDFSHIGTCIGTTGFSVPPFDEKGINITYRKPEPVEVTVSPACKVTIEKHHHVSVSFGSMPEQSIREGTLVSIEFLGERHFTECWKLLHLFCSFLSFATGKPIYPLAIKGITEKEEDRVEVFCRFPISQTRTVPFETLLFSEKYSLGEIDSFLKNWFEKAGILEPVFGLYAKILDTSKPFSSDDFITLISALETCHRRLHDGKYLSDDEYGKLVKDIEKNVSTENKGVKEILGRMGEYLNEFTLRKRLRELFSKYKVILGDFVAREDEFIDCLVKTRNYFVHYDEKDREGAAKVKDFIGFSWQ